MLVQMLVVHNGKSSFAIASPFLAVARGLPRERAFSKLKRMVPRLRSCLAPERVASSLVLMSTLPFAAFASLTIATSWPLRKEASRG
jgi:hypothetical protein